MSAQTVLVVDDEPVLRNLLSHLLHLEGYKVLDATVTEHVRRLRRKIEVDPDHPRWITTVRGVGYRFEP